MSLYRAWKKSKFNSTLEGDNRKKVVRFPTKWRNGIPSQMNTKRDSTDEYLELRIGMMEKGLLRQYISGYGQQKVLEDANRSFVYSGIRTKLQFDEIYEKETQGKEWKTWANTPTKKEAEDKEKALKSLKNVDGHFQKSYSIIRDTQPVTHEPFRTDWSEDEWKNCQSLPSSRKNRT